MEPTLAPYPRLADDVSHSGRRSSDRSTGATTDQSTRRLARLCADLQRCQAQIDRLAGSSANAEELDVVLDDWWSTVESITTARAKTTVGIRAKARAVRTVMVALGRDRSPVAIALLASLLADLLDEPVELP